MCGASSLEKADILELTVDHLRLLRTRTDQQRAYGYNRCAREVDQFLLTSAVEGDMRRRLMAFLARRQPLQQSHSSLFHRQGPNWSTEMATRFDEHRQDTSFGFETMVTNSRTELSVIQHPSLLNHVRQLSPFSNVQSAVVDTTICEERRVVPEEEEEEEEDFVEREEEYDEKPQSSVTKLPKRKHTASQESSVCSQSIVNDLSKYSVRLVERDSTNDVLGRSTLPRGSDCQELVWRPW